MPAIERGFKLARFLRNNVTVGLFDPRMTTGDWACLEAFWTACDKADLKDQQFEEAKAKQRELESRSRRR